MSPLCLPPGPKGHFLMGNATEFGHDVLGFLTGAAREYGDVVQIRIGPKKMYLLSRSEEIEDVLVTHRQNFRKPKSVRVEGRIIFGEALTASDGDRWVRQRRLAAPAFHTQRIDAYGEAVVRYTEGGVAKRQLTRRSLAVRPGSFSEFSAETVMLSIV